MTKYLIYIAAPYSASTPIRIKDNVDKAVKLAAEINDAGNDELFAICPHPMGYAINQKMKSKPPESFWYDGDISLLKRCDAMIVGHGWRASLGCRNEIYKADEFNIPVLYHKGDAETTAKTIISWLNLNKDEIIAFTVMKLQIQLKKETKTLNDLGYTISPKLKQG